MARPVYMSGNIMVSENLERFKTQHAFIKTRIIVVHILPCSFHVVFSKLMHSIKCNSVSSCDADASHFSSQV